MKYLRKSSSYTTSIRGVKYIGNMKMQRNIARFFVQVNHNHDFPSAFIGRPLLVILVPWCGACLQTSQI